MKTFARIALLVLLLFVFALPVLAQEGETPPVDPVDGAFASVLLLAGAVAGFVEWLKPTLDRARLRYAWSDDGHKFAVRLVSVAASFALVFLTANDANILTAFGITVDLPEWAAKAVTAFALSGGSMLLWSLYRFFKLMPVPTIVTATVEEVRRE